MDQSSFSAVLISQEQENTPATGEPYVTGWARIGETVIVEIFDIADDDGLSSAEFTYQWIRRDLVAATDADIEGQTGETYAVAAVDEGKAIKVRVSFTDDGGNEESLTSAATAAVKAPLTATADDVPASHHGVDTVFTFEVRFSEEPKAGLGYEKMRDHVFTVTGGSVTGARRLAAPSDIG